jgi:hypothetical protein
MLNDFFSSLLYTNGFIWEIQDSLSVGYQVRYTEGHMFQSNHGPPLLETGSSYIDFDTTITI